MTTPGVGVLVALTFVAAVDDPERFRSSRVVGPHFGLTPKKYQSGETDYTGRISKIGDAGVCTALYEAAKVILMRPAKGSNLKTWALGVAKRADMRKAKVALARKLALCCIACCAIRPLSSPIGLRPQWPPPRTQGDDLSGGASPSPFWSEVLSPGRWSDQIVTSDAVLVTALKRDRSVDPQQTSSSRDVDLLRTEARIRRGDGSLKRVDSGARYKSAHKDELRAQYHTPTVSRLPRRSHLDRLPARLRAHQDRKPLLVDLCSAHMVKCGDAPHSPHLSYVYARTTASAVPGFYETKRRAEVTACLK